MIVAIPTWQGRISPVFDVARHLLLVEVERGRELSRTEETIEQTHLARRAERVARLGTDVLICGAISRPLEAILVSVGVRVIPQTCGPVEEVLRAFASGQLTEQAFLMPGCCGRRRRFRGRRRRGESRSTA
jgi:predicted Fe-Mo cluster-binding NifX family protein